MLRIAATLYGKSAEEILIESWIYMEEYNCGTLLKVIWKPTFVKTGHMTTKIDTEYDAEKQEFLNPSKQCNSCFLYNFFRYVCGHNLVFLFFIFLVSMTYFCNS